MKKPALGIMPEYIWREQRVKDLKETLERRLKNCDPILEEWYVELQNHTKWLVDYYSNKI